MDGNRVLPMTRDELLEIFAGGRVEVLKTSRARRFLLKRTDGEICRLWGRSCVTRHDPHQARRAAEPTEWKNWSGEPTGTRCSSRASKSTGSRSAMKQHIYDHYEQ